MCKALRSFTLIALLLIHTHTHTHMQAVSEASAHSLWEEVSDPTERLALALGLDPANLAINTGIPTTDA